MVKAENMVNSRGNPVLRQFIIRVGNATYFQSYDSIIAKRIGNQTYLDQKWWDYSYTTGKYRNIFLQEDIKETRKNIINGTYKLRDLNK